jgi:hypothetical protein
MLCHLTSKQPTSEDQRYDIYHWKTSNRATASHFWQRMGTAKSSNSFLQNKTTTNIRIEEHEYEGSNKVVS